ncbi:hypothetical protein ACFV5G_23320, partial [Streptomyces sp. NPDC059766]
MSTAATPSAAAVYEQLLSSLPRSEDGRPAWHVADPYLLRHAAQHAAKAGRANELIQDTEFLVHGHPDLVNAALST